MKKVKWLKPIRLACDTVAMIEPVRKAVELLRKHGATPKAYFCYVLVTDNISDALKRVEFLRALNVDPFAQPYRSPDGREPSRVARNFARWVNHKAIFKTVTWENYQEG